MAERNRGDDFYIAIAIVSVVALAAVLCGVAWLIPTVAAWAHSGQTAPLTLIDAGSAVLHGGLFGSDPASAYAPSVRQLLPGALGFWGVGALLLVTLAAAVSGAARALDVAMSRPVADRRWYQLRGRNAHEFGRYRTMGDLIVTAPAPDRVIVGTIAQPKAMIAVTGSAQIAVIAAPRQGKTSSIMIPAVLEHEGPVVTTSVRGDLAAETLARRRSMGRVFYWDPFGETTDSWNLLQGCESWEHALLVARWLGQARKIGEGIREDYFDEDAEGLVAPLLHAAALAGDITTPGVYRWILVRDEKTPAKILREAGTPDALAALERLQAVYAYTERQRDGLIGTVSVQLKAYGHPAAAKSAGVGRGLTPQALFDGKPNTLYIVAELEHQKLLAPLVVTMISSLMFWLSKNENRDKPLDPPALFALDETAQIAPLQGLPEILATSLPSARFLTVWHSVAQIRRRFGVDAAAEIMALSQAKVFLGSITDQYTREMIVELLGRRAQLTNTEAPGRGLDIMSAQALQRTSDGEGLLVHGDMPPVMFRQRRHYEDGELKRLKGTPPVGAAPPRSAGEIPAPTGGGAVANGSGQDTALAAFGQVQAVTPRARRKELDTEVAAAKERRDLKPQIELGIPDGGIER